MNMSHSLNELVSLKQ